MDVGGTFTDLIAYDGESGEVTLSKSASTADAPEQAVIESVAAGVPPEVISTAEFFLHGTTVALNALLTRSGAKLGLLATAGFRDVLEVRRGSREEMLNLWWRPPEPLVPRSCESRSASGSGPTGRSTPRSPTRTWRQRPRPSARRRRSGFDRVHQRLPQPRQRALGGRVLRRHGFEGEISLSHRVSREYREFERTSTTVIDAYVRGIAGGYLERLGGGLAALGSSATTLLMRSGGGAMTFEEAADRPFETIISGPVAGVEGAAGLARELEIDQVIAADVGGTSFDVSVVVDGLPQP